MERLVSKMAHNVLKATLNPTHSLTHSLTHCADCSGLEADYRTHNCREVAGPRSSARNALSKWLGQLSLLPSTRRETNIMPCVQYGIYGVKAANWAIVCLLASQLVQS